MGLPLHINAQGLAQHYGLHTDMLDVTSDFDVASFFATCYWDRQKKCFLPVEDRNKIGVIYRINVPFAVMTGAPLKFVGWQPLMRPEQQRAGALALKKSEDLTRLPYVEAAEFRQNPDVSHRIWAQFEQGKLLFPDDAAAYLADKAQVLVSFTDEEINSAWQRLEAWNGTSYQPAQRQATEEMAHVIRTAGSSLSWDVATVNKGTEFWEQRFLEEMSRVRVRTVGDHQNGRPECAYSD